MKNSFLFLLILVLGLPTILHGQNPTEIVRRADQKLRGTSSYAEITMSIVRPSWTREVTLKSWSMGNEFALIKITAPARDKGSATLKREKEIWSWQPSIDRVIKLPPSMMMQSWMGSDFTNDDLVQESSIVTDYEHRLVQTEVLEGRDCYVIELIPKPDAPVVWGRILIWISQEEYLQLKTAFYDEDDYLVNTMYGREVKQLGGKLLPSVLEMVPEDEPGNKTIITYQRFEFDLDLATSFFSIQNMKRVR
ncbi:MAG: outer membrane lipoprotein-sorting protein [Saprospiraceae bacterium]|nr:outer membrane lipoprotein-sorting protein [Saprospiraceae bacterium]